MKRKIINIKTRTHSYTTRLEYFKDDGQEGYLVTVPSLRGCVTWGKTYDEALDQAEECIRGFLEALTKAGQPIPQEPQPRLPIETQIRIKSLALANL